MNKTGTYRYTAWLKKEALLPLCLVAVLFASGQSWEEGFKNPPASARPKTWIHAMSGNMSAEGLTKDLESMADVGLGGLLLFNVTQGIPKGNVKYNSPEHISLLTHAAKEAKRLGLTFGVHNCDGWSSSGGPWVTPEESMKMVVWSETLVQGGEKITVTLPQPTTREGLYRDISVIAYPALRGEMADTTTAIITASDAGFNVQQATDRQWEETASFAKNGPAQPWLQFQYAKPHTVASATVLVTDRNGTAQLLRSDDGAHFTIAATLQKVRTGKGEWVFSSSFAPVTARYFRLAFSEAVSVKEAALSAAPILPNFFGRTAMARAEAAELGPIGTATPDGRIAKNAVLVLGTPTTNGDINLNLPDGLWTVMRFGYTSTGAFNNPASDEGRGLEVDKLSRPPFKKHYDAFVKKLVKAAGPDAVQYVEIDSYEMGGQNWTDDFAAIFQTKKGYDLLPFLPLLAGRFVESPETSEAVLQDFREVVSQLMTENYFGYFQELCHQDGIKTYIENYGFGPLNDLDVGSKADIPMGEFWMARPITQVASPVSAAHIYGRNVVSAESFTSDPEINWKGHPAMAKLSGDKAWALGINEFMFHRFAHQANTHVQPGMTMNRWGFHMDRTQTWWQSAGAAWFRYIARGSFLLRQGVPVSDLLVFVGDAAPNGTVSRTDFSTPLPQGYNYDCVNTDVLLNRIKPVADKLVLPEGTTYKALVLKNSETIKLSTLQRFHQLALAGVPIIGEKPKGLLGYGHTPADRQTFDKLVTDIWNAENVKTNFNWPVVLPELGIKKDFFVHNRTDIPSLHRRDGNSELYFTYNPDTVANDFVVSFAVTGKLPELWNPLTGIITRTAQFTQRNGYTQVQLQLAPEESVFVVFRQPATGLPSVTADVPSSTHFFTLSENNRLQLNATQNGQFAATKADGKRVQVAVTDLPPALKLKGNWSVSFDRQGGYGGTVKLKTLTDWKDHPNDSIRHYSGTAVYQQTFTVPKTFLAANNKITLDLGQVAIVARVELNGKDLGVAWMPPFRLDVTNAIRPGENRIRIHVTNQWSNRLIGDERYPPQDGGYQLEQQRPKGFMPQWYTNNQPLPPGPRTTFTTAPFYRQDDMLEPSGLLGPVRLTVSKIINVAE